MCIFFGITVFYHPVISFSFKLAYKTWALNVAILLRNASASVGVNPAATIAIFIAAPGIMELLMCV
jgi:hypothetical protein